MKRISIVALFLVLQAIPIVGYWTEESQQELTRETVNSATLGDYCYGCTYYDPAKNHQPGEIVLTQNPEELIYVISPSAGKPNPNTIPKDGSTVGRTYPSNQVWFIRVDSNEFVAHHRYYEGDIVRFGDKLYTFIGDYRRAHRTQSCSLGSRVYDPFVAGCWGRPNQTSWLYGKVFWREADTSLLTIPKDQIYSEYKLYKKGDVMYRLKSDVTVHVKDREEFIVNTILQDSDYRMCTLLDDTRPNGDKGFLGYSDSDFDSKWECQ